VFREFNMFIEYFNPPRDGGGPRSFPSAAPAWEIRGPPLPSALLISRSSSAPATRHNGSSHRKGPDGKVMPAA